MSDYENKVNKRRARSSYISVVISMSLVLFMIGFIGVLLINAKQFSDFVKENISLDIVFSDGAKENQIDELVKKIKLSDYSRDQLFIDKEQALIHGREATGMSKDDPFYNEPIFPASLHVYLKAEYVEPEKVDSIASKLRSNSIIDKIGYPKDELDIIYRNISKISFWALVVAGLFLIIAVVLINNSIRLNIYSKRFTIKTMQLIGAKKSFIRKPFLWKSIFVGLISALLAILAIGGILYYLFFYKKLYQEPFVLDYGMLGLLALGIIVIGILLSFLSTYFATSKFLKLRTDQLYY
ncbi:MAG: cell division protein FtsX [Flavobacteriales bacterium]